MGARDQNHTPEASIEEPIDPAHDGILALTRAEAIKRLPAHSKRGS